MGRKDKQLLSDRNYHQQQYICFHQPVLNIIMLKIQLFFSQLFKVGVEKKICNWGGGLVYLQTKTESPLQICNGAKSREKAVCLAI